MALKSRRDHVKGCPYCPAALPLRATVCDRCGRDLTRAPTRDVPSPWAGRGWWIVLLVLAGLVAIAAAVG